MLEGPDLEIEPSLPRAQLVYELNGQSGVVDPLARVHKEISVDQHETTTFYEGNLTRTVDALDHEIRSRFDHARNEIQREVVEAGATVRRRLTFEYDAAGKQLSSSLDPLDGGAAIVSTVEYDWHGRAIERTDPDSGTWRTEYNAVGKVSFEDDPVPNQGVQTCYDALDRVAFTCGLASDTQIAGLCSTGPSACTGTLYEYYYDDNSNGNMGAGRLTSTSGPSSTESLVYDARGNVLEQTRTVAGKTATMLFTYNSVDRVETITYPAGERVLYSYDPGGLPFALEELDATDAVIFKYILSVAYDHRSRPIEIERGNGFTDTYAFWDESEGFRARSVHSTNGTDTALHYEHSDYDELGRLRLTTDLHFDASDQRNLTAEYVYDSLGRLEQVKNSAGGFANEIFSYDDIGNITSRDSDDHNWDFIYDSHRPHQLDAVESQGDTVYSLGHHPDGAQAFKTNPSGPDSTYTYDAFGKLSTVLRGGVATTYAYGAGGERISRIVDGNRRRFFSRYAESEHHGLLVKHYWFGGQLLATRVEDAPEFSDAAADSLPFVLQVPPEAYCAMGAAIAVLLSAPWGRRRVVSAGLVMTRTRATGGAFLAVLTVLPLTIATGCGGSESTRHFHLSPVGSVLATSSHLGITNHVRYWAYGEERIRTDGSGVPTTSKDSEYTFATYREDAEADLLYAQARHYDAELAQFLTVDPAGQFDSPYSYTGWDPINASDPTGQISLFGLFLGLVFALFSAIVVGAEAGSFSAGLQAFALGVAFAVISANFAVPLLDAGTGVLLDEAGARAVLTTAGIGQSSYSLATEGPNPAAVIGITLAAASLASAFGAALDGGVDKAHAPHPSGDGQGGGDLSQEDVDFIKEWTRNNDDVIDIPDDVSVQIDPTFQGTPNADARAYYDSATDTIHLAQDRIPHMASAAELLVHEYTHRFNRFNHPFRYHARRILESPLIDKFPNQLHGAVEDAGISAMRLYFQDWQRGDVPIGFSQ